MNLLIKYGLAWMSGLSFLMPIMGQAEFHPNEVSYVMSVELDPATSQITGHEKVRVTNHSRETFKQLYFHVYPNAFRWEKDGTYMQEIRKYESPDLHFLLSGKGAWLKIDHIRQGSHDAKFEISQELMTVTLPTPLGPGQTAELDVDFVTQIGAIAERSGTWDGNYSIGQWFPKLMVYDEKGWALEHNRGYHFVGEFYGDFGSYDVQITVPKDMKIGATGHLMEEHAAADGRRKTLRYRAERVHDFAWVADARFEEHTVHVGKTTIHVLTRYPGSAEPMLLYAKRSFEYYSKRIGPYPYEDYTVAETNYNGTMEYPQLIFVRAWPAGFARWLERELVGELLELYVIHETGHQWFFGVVGNNEVVNAWLDEGFTTYLEEAYMRDTYGADENFFRMEPFKSLLKMSDRQVGDMIWRVTGPDVSQPVQTPSYRFKDPMHYDASVYYRVALFFRHFEALMGREKFDAILREYYKRNMFRNAEPENWYQVVREMAGAEAESWWRSWINDSPRCDYAVQSIGSQKQPDGFFHQRFRVVQEGKYYAPVDVDVIDKSGVKKRVRAAITADQHEVVMDVAMSAALKSVEVDPDHVTPDMDRFNNTPGIFADFELWPWTTKTLREDAVTLIPLPFYMKRPGIGNETGLMLGAAHYVDWFGYGFAGYDWLHHSPTALASVATLQPELKFGWQLDYERDVILHRGDFYFSRFLGPEVGHDPRFSVLAGPEFFGSVGDGKNAAGAGGEVAYTNIDNGHDIRYSAAVHGSVLSNLSDGQGVATRLYGKGRFIVPLFHRARFDVKGIVGDSNGNLNQSALYDLVADPEGAMRFDYDYGNFRLRTIRAANAEVQLPIPYTTFSDKLFFVHGPTWELHFFGDFSNSPDKIRTIMDFGIGTRFQIPTGAYGSFVLNVELVPYQNAESPAGWGLPVFFVTVQDRVF